MATSSRKRALCAAVLLLPPILPALSRECAAQDQKNAGGDQSLKNLSLEQLGNIQVTTVSKEPEEVWKTPAAVFVITQQDIQRSGVTSIPEALRLAPGVEVARISADQWAIGIRGFGSRLSRSVLVLIDGRIVYSPLTAGVYWEVQDTLIEDIDRIEVIRGPGATIWGPNAVNGVINIITKSSKDTLGGLVSGGAGNVEQGFGEARYGAGNGRNLTYRLYGKGFARTPQFHSDGINYDDWQAGQGGFRMDWSGGTRDSFTLQGDGYYQSAGESVNDSSYNPPANYTFDGDARLSGGNILWRWKRTFAERKDFHLDAYYDQTSRHELNFGDVRNTINLDFLDRFPLPRQEISWGLGLYLSHGHEQQILTGLIFDPAIRTDQLYTAFLQDEIALVPNRLSLFAGSKFLKTNYTGLLLEPSARLLYTPRPTQTLWAAFTQAVRTPADVERDFFLSSFIGTAPGGLPFFARFNANRNFQSERMNGYEAGYRQLLKSKLYLDLAAFFNQYRNLLSEDITGAPFVEATPAPTHLLLPAEFGNGLVATTEGGEVMAEWQATRIWRLSGSYSFLEMHVKRAPQSMDIGSAPIIQGSSPQHQALLQSSLDLPRSITAFLQARYVSDLPALMVPAYWTGDASLGYNLTKQLRLMVVGENLFQPYHYEFLYDPRGLVGIERSLFGRITWRWE
ncbi:MAG TPA: TonB-dependent receptor [Candidatus Binatia bacterium]|nr:TonB-dependent receptor [Candidatus Binatia bacterium]